MKTKRNPFSLEPDDENQFPVFLIFMNTFLIFLKLNTNYMTFHRGVNLNRFIKKYHS